MIDGRQRNREAEVRKRRLDAGNRQAAEAETEQCRTPCDQHADGDGDQTGRNAFRVTHASKPAHHDDGKAGQADNRRHEHSQRRKHRDERHRNASQRAKQRGAWRNHADIGGDEAADHQNEALEENPDEARFPALDRITGRQGDRQHDHERDDKHVRHADARRHGADVTAAGFLGQLIGEIRVVKRAQAHHQAERRQDAAKHNGVRHLDDEAQQAGQCQHVDENVGAEAEEGVPVAWRPYCRFESRRCSHLLNSPSYRQIEIRNPR